MLCLASELPERRSATMSNASLFCGTLEPTRMRWECGQVRVTRLRKGSNCAGVQRCQVCAPINTHAHRHRHTQTHTDTDTHRHRHTHRHTDTDTDTDTDLRNRSSSGTRMNHQCANGGSCAHRLSTKTVTSHVCETLVDERCLCIRSLSCLRSNLLCCACSLRMILLGPGRLVLRR